MTIFEVQVETLKGKWVSVISYHTADAEARAKRMARTLNLVAGAQVKGKLRWARVRRAKK
jgi:hypothetical protein